MSTEMNELVVANNQLKTQLAVPRPSGSQNMDKKCMNNLRDELTSERKSQLIWRWPTMTRDRGTT